MDVLEKLQGLQQKEAKRENFRNVAGDLNDRLTTRMGYQQLVDRGIIKEWNERKDEHSSTKKSGEKEKGRIESIAQKMHDIITPPLIKPGKPQINLRKNN